MTLDQIRAAGRRAHQLGAKRKENPWVIGWPEQTAEGVAKANAWDEGWQAAAAEWARVVEAERELRGK